MTSSPPLLRHSLALARLAFEFRLLPIDLAHAMTGVPRHRVEPRRELPLHLLGKGTLRSDVLSSVYQTNSEFHTHSDPFTPEEQRKNGRATRTRWTDTASRRTRPRRPNLVDLRRRQLTRRIRCQPLPLFFQHFSSPCRHAPAERPAPRRPQSRHLQVPSLAQRPTRRPRRSHPPREVTGRSSGKK